MKNRETSANPQQTGTDSDPIPLHDRAVLAMFLLGFLVFGLILLGDLIAGFFR